ncbi:MAG: hypothetical protein GKR77_00870 [Legionellales bacterium]|nr:hypothetical protein [Legionellales bacterium]
MKLWILIMLGMALNGCAAPDYWDYLRQPQQLSRAYQDCRAQTQPHCEIVLQAWQDYWRYVTEYQVNSADYGQRILAIQQQMVALQTELAEAKASSDETLQQSYQQSLQQLQREYQGRLAVIRSGRIQ